MRGPLLEEDRGDRDREIGWKKPLENGSPGEILTSEKPILKPIGKGF